MVSLLWKRNDDLNVIDGKETAFPFEFAFEPAEKQEKLVLRKIVSLEKMLHIKGFVYSRNMVYLSIHSLYP